MLFSIQKKFMKARRQYHLSMRSRSARHLGVRLPLDPEVVPREVIDLILRGRYERQEAILASSELSPRDRVLEIGGGIGFMGTLAALICGSENVVTYEANPDLENIIRLTHRLNGVGPTLRMKAVADQAGKMAFYRNDNVVSSSLVDRNFGGEMEVETVSFKEIVSSFNPTVIICDIEGAEVSIFPTSDLETVDKILIELHPKIVGDDANTALVEYLQSKGFVLTDGVTSKVALFKRASDASGSGGVNAV